MIKSAILSECGTYRYALTRIWEPNKPRVMFVMLNPSTADAQEDDATIRRCIGFAKSWGYGGLHVGNLYAYRTKNPKLLKLASDPVGKENWYHIPRMALNCEIVVCAWGNNEQPQALSFRTLEKLHYLEVSKNGIPKHPLYLKKTLKPKPFKFKFNEIQ